MSYTLRCYLFGVCILSRFIYIVNIFLCFFFSECT
nr:MAG TPA: Export chaperone [Caudoviricetes sp.]